MRHYLDYNATAPLRPQVVRLMAELQAQPLNASSVHADGRKAKGLIEDSRRTIAENIGAFANEIVFTGSGTEANNWVLRSHTHMPIYISSIEHSSLLSNPQVGVKPTLIPVTHEGIIDIAALESMLPARGPFLVSLMLANNETGVIQPVQIVTQLVHARGGFMHCDAVQAYGKIHVDFTALGCDFMTLSSHKMGGPVGAAVLVIKNGLALPPMLTGGGQEMNRRAGTENVAAIAGFAKATMLIDYTQMLTLRSWLDAMETHMQSLAGSHAEVFGKGALRLPNTSLISLQGISSETQLIRFDLEGIAVSAGSACSSGRIEPSHVLKAMGINDAQSGCALRISGGWATTKADIDAAAAIWAKLFYTISHA